jgi:hypothetical protein
MLFDGLVHILFPTSRISAVPLPVSLNDTAVAASGIGLTG